MAPTPAEIRLPDELRPTDGRFGSGPSKVRTESVASLLAAAPKYLGTSHRQGTVRDVVRRAREGLAALFSLPEGYEVLLGNGGATQFWDCATFGLVEERSQHLVFGEFSSKFAKACATAPHLQEPEVVESAYGTHPEPVPSVAVDVLALTHNETSTGVAMPIRRPGGFRDDCLVVVDATSAAGGMRVDTSEVDCYYFSPQKCFGSEAGIWLALLSPAAVARVERLGGSGRWAPSSLDLTLALDNSRKNQTYNTPALGSLWLLAESVEWLLANGGLEWAAKRCETSAQTLYGWAEASSVALPFVTDPAKRSATVATIDFVDGVDASAIAATLRANGVLDTEPYRKLGRNQLRIAMFPAIEPDDVEVLTRAIDYVVEELG